MKTNYVVQKFFVLLVFLLLSACSKENENEAVITRGEVIFKETCKVCHAQGINGAPIVGNKKMWGERVKQGVPTLVEHAANGFGLMPAKGGNTALSEEDIAAAVTYMVSKL